ncbi:DUF6024 family protein [Pantoea sp.]|uniref:DUF6024 family protein n=1 Tax=Pantoea sp. TaxID=69393 RepID=UPI0028AF0AC2|nr:DUF6024 family protein [Pantoea sp.]
MARQNASARAAARDRLRGLLSRHYRLEQYDLFFVPSLHIARVLLSQLFLRQEQARNQSRYASQYRASELSVLPAVPVCRSWREISRWLNMWICFMAACARWMNAKARG